MRLKTPSARLVPLLPVVATAAVSLALLRHELTEVPYLNDEAIHEEMVRFSLEKLRSGHLPLDSWFPFLNEGSPQFLHYQSLGAMLTSLAAWAIGVGHAFTISTWLLVGCWPLCVYGAARVFRLGRGAAMAAAVLSPFVSSFTHVGYEQISYLWSGYGLWSQLWAMWTLPFAWAFSWRAVDEGRFFAPAAVFIAATAAFHFETGYLAFVAVPLFVLVHPGGLGRRAGRGAVVAAGGFGLAAWAIVPLVAQGRWAAVNQYLQSGPEGADANSYGASRVLSALVHGQLLDSGHLPVISLLFAAGVVACVLAWRHEDEAAALPSGTARALLLMFAGCLVLFFGRPSLGSLLDLLPGAKDLFLRRFIVGVQLAALFVAGAGAAWLSSLALRLAGRLGERASDQVTVVRTVATIRTGVRAAIVLVAVAAAVPLWAFVGHQAAGSADLIAHQASAVGQTRDIDAIIDTIEARGGGRTYAGSPDDYGSTFTVGEVPVFKYLACRDVDEVGFTVRTASLMSGPEVQFLAEQPGDLAAFGVRWLVLPTHATPATQASRVERRGPYALWEVSGNGYVQVVDTRGEIAGNSADLGSFAGSFLPTLPAVGAVYPTVAYAGAPAAPGTLTDLVAPAGPAGTVRSQRADLVNGTVGAVVDANRTAVVLLSASYDPGWQVTIDGHPATTEMVAPALVGVRVGPGRHTVRFVYKGYPDYPELFGLGLVTLIALIAFERRRSRRA